VGVFLFNILGSVCIGVYSLAVDDVVLVPPQVPENKVQRLENWLKAKVVRTTIGESTLIGILARANSNGMVLPHFVQMNEVQAVKSALDVNVAVMETRQTAYGNLILTNDRGAVVDPRLKRGDVAKIADTLGTDTVPGKIAGLPYVGSLAVATNKGVLAHPMLEDEERELLADVLKVPVDVGTVNCGIPYVATGLIGNTEGMVAGFMTTGPEIFIIGHALGVMEENE
jgi:translation initiation factor 6